MPERPSPQSGERAIIHVDMDAFYASVEQRDDPAIRGLPVIVGGLGRRGVVAAASYEAREFGVHSALPMARARKLCPDGIYLSPRFERYRAVSARIFEVFREFTPLVEGISLDEAWLDVTDSRSLFGDLRTIAGRVKESIRERTGLVASIGMAPNKFLAKLASDQDKPDGFFQITAEDARHFLASLPVERLWGIGPRAASKLNTSGIRTVGGLRHADDALLARLLGRSAAHFRALANGVDDRPVTPARPEKSVSHERTFDRDLGDTAALRRALLGLSEAVGSRTRRKALVGLTVSVKIRTAAWDTYTRSRTLSVPTQSTAEIYRTANDLLELWRREHAAPPVRLLGVGLSRLESRGQGALFDPSDSRVDATLDHIRARFGESAVVRGRISSLSDDDDA